MKNKLLLSLLAVAILIFVAGCSLPTGAGPGPRAWIDNPLDEDTLALGPLVVQSHASSEGGTTSAALLVNGAQMRVDNSANSSDPLTSFTQAWTPTAPGDYTLEVIATDSQGNTGRSNRVLVHIGGPAVDVTVAPISPITPTFSPVPQAVITVTPSVIPNLKPTFTFTINGNCRRGPGTAYEVVTSFYAGDQVTIEGRNDGSSWYWVLIPNSDSHCWVSGSTGSPQGPMGGLAVVPAPALPATTVAPPPVVIVTTPAPPPVPPAAPGKFNVSDKSCSSSGYIVTLSWQDVSREDGYRVYRDGALIATLPANTTQYDDAAPDFNSHKYYVEAYNSSGSANSSSANSQGCLY